MDPGVWIANGLALVALVISSLAYRRVRRDDRTADLVAWLESETGFDTTTGVTGDWSALGIDNRGKHDARDITIEVVYLMSADRLSETVTLALVNGLSKYPKAASW